jgi:hypothetical protein
VDDWLTRLDESGMIIGHSTGTTGKLSFIPRSQSEWPAWRNAHFVAMTAALGVDLREVRVPQFSAGYRSGHQMMTKMGRLMGAEQAGGNESRVTLYDYPLSSDLLSLAGRLHAAEENGELDKLEIDPKILGPHGVTVNAIPPGFIDTPMTRRNEAKGRLGPGGMDEAIARTPVGRAGRPEDIAATCAFLVSDEASYITGQIIGVNGGRNT